MLILFLIFALFLPLSAAEYHLNTNAETGYRASGDTAIENAAFVSAGVEPWMGFTLSGNAKWEAGIFGGTNVYLGQYTDWNTGARLKRLWDVEKNTASIGASLGYYSQSQVDDPTQLANYALLGILGEYRLNISTPMTFGLFCDMASDPNSRTDTKAGLRYRVTFKPSVSFNPFLRAGLAYNASSVPDYSCSEFSFGGGASWMPGDKDMFLGSATVYMRTYSAENSATPIAQINAGKPKMGQRNNDRSVSTSQSSIFLSYTRELTSSLDASCNVMLGFYNSGVESSSYSSQRVSLEISARL